MLPRPQLLWAYWEFTVHSSLENHLQPKGASCLAMPNTLHSSPKGGPQPMTEWHRYIYKNLDLLPSFYVNHVLELPMESGLRLDLKLKSRLCLVFSSALSCFPDLLTGFLLKALPQWITSSKISMLGSAFKSPGLVALLRASPDRSWFFMLHIV